MSLSIEQIEILLEEMEITMQNIAIQLSNMELCGVTDNRYTDLIIEAQSYVTLKAELVNTLTQLQQQEQNSNEASTEETNEQVTTNA